jgi:thioredoxin 1
MEAVFSTNRRAVRRLRRSCTDYRTPDGAPAPVERLGFRAYRSWAMHYFRAVYLSALISILAATSVSPCRAAQPDIYPPPAQAATDITAALKTAASTHKRVILDFGGNWCTDCHALDFYLHDAVNQPIVEANYILVHVNIGRLDANVDIAARYQIPLDKGVPALAVLDRRGKLLHSQKAGEFEAMRHMQSGAVTDFLRHWKGSAS